MGRKGLLDFSRALPLGTMIAQKTSPCACGSWVRPGDPFRFQDGETVGCRACNFTGEDPSGGERGDEDDHLRGGFLEGWHVYE